MSSLKFLRGMTILKIIRTAHRIRQNVISTSVTVPYEIKKIHKPKEIRNENDLVFIEDPDTFGTLNRKSIMPSETLDDEGDKKEQDFLQNIPLPTHKLTIKQYSDLIKQYLKHKRLKEAIDVLEVRMLKQDRVKPENYIYNILIGACAEVGYTKKAFKLYNDMKRRGLSATGDTYTCLFEACSNSPWALDGLKNATHLRNLMVEKGVKPNLTNYNAMIKAFGRNGDLVTAFKIVDEMISKKIKIRVHTFNHLLQACISAKETGLRHALVVWRKMIKSREKPNIYSFNLMLKCVKECNLGTKEDIEELIQIIQRETPMAIEKSSQVKILQIESSEKEMDNTRMTAVESTMTNKSAINMEKEHNMEHTEEPKITRNKENMPTSIIMDIEFVHKVPAIKTIERTVPNLLSKKINLQQVLGLQTVKTVQEKFAIIGGQEDFLKEMNEYSVRPDLKTFTQMLPLLDDTLEAENKLLESVKTFNIKTDIDFYNMLIKKRCLRSDYENAIAVKEIIQDYNKVLKKKHPLKNLLKLNVMSYGVLAMTCQTKDSAEKLLSEMKEKQIGPNIQILGTLLRHGTAHSSFSYIVYIMNIVKEENIKVNEIFLKHLEDFNDKCSNILQQVDKNGKSKSREGFERGYKKFVTFYKQWLQEVDIQEALTLEHPWQQFKENYPETVQHTNVKIEEPKRFYKRNRRYIKYVPRV